MANVGVVGQTATVTQSFHQQQVMRQRSERIDLKTPEADLGDVEADFQSLVNEMAKDSGSVKSFSATNMKQETFSSSTVSKQSFSSSSSGSSHVISTKLNGGLGTQMLTQAPASPKTEVPQPSVPITVDTGMVTAVPAQVIPDEGQRGGGESEVVVEKPMRVRDRIKKIEKQLSTEEIPTGPPEVLVPRGRSGSVKNLAEQFNQPNESTPPMPSVNASAFKHSRSLSGSSPSLTGSCGGSTTNLSGEGVVTTEFKSVKEIVSSFSQQEESTVGKKVEGEFKSVKETASIFQDPIQPLTTPIRPPPAFLTDGEAPPAAEEVEVLEPVAVLPPATMTRSAPAPAPAKAPAAAIAPPQFTPIPAPEAVPTVPPKPEAPAAGPSAPDSQPTLAPEPASIYEFTPSPKTAPTPTPSVPEPIAPVAEPAPVVPPREAKPTAPPPVPAKNTQEEKAAPPPAAAPKPAATQASPAPPAPKEQVSAEETAAAAVTLTKSSSVTASESERIFEEALAEITKYSETLSQTSTESRSTSAETVVQQPIQYSAQVKCEVRSRVNTPEVPVAHEQLHQQIYQEQHQQKQKQQQHEQQQQKQVKQPQKPQQQQTSTSQTSAAASQKKTEMKTTTTTTTSTFSSAVSQSKSSSAQIQSSKATIAKTAAKPPKFEPSEGPPKFSLLRSNSTGSMGSTKAVASGMKHAGSDKDLPKFSVKKVKDNLTTNARVWSPGRTEKDDSGPSRIDAPDLPSFKDQPKVWTPRAGSASPSLGRKDYRKITYEPSSSPQRRPSQENITAPSIEESFAWKDANVDKVARSPTSTLPKVQNPTVTLLQKKREGQIPGKRPEYLKPDDGPKYRPDDKLYVIKREYESEEEGGEGRRFAVLGPKKVTGVGPTTKDGVPTTLKSGVKSEHQGEWYKRMFDSLHKIKDARYGGYMSEPEGYDSDIGGGTLRYATVDRRRGPQYEADPMTSSLPRECLIDLDPYDRNTSRYVHQPGRIEDYVPGYSSLAEKELKRNPDADVKLESQSQEPPPVSVNHRFGSQMMSMTHALKESGYESDSTLVFKKREDARRLAPDPRKTSQVYRQIQRGGDIPITGLQKPNPPKPKESPYKYESGEVNIHYRTPVRIEQKESIPEEELARRQEEHMKKVYENERRKKYLAELEDIERRRHTDNFTPLQKSPIPLNRYDDESSLGTMRGVRTPDLKQVAKALYNFSAQNKREISFNKGDVVFIRRQIDKNWYEGEHRGSVGIFPCNYVEIVPYDSIRTLTRKPTEGQARARFNFQAQTSMEMSLSKGELVVLTRRVDENWYEGRIGNRKGIFPVSYVDTLMEPGADRPLTPSSSPMPRPALPAANLLYNGASSYSSPYSTLGRPGSQNDSRPYHQSLTVNTQQEPVPYRALYNYKPQNDDELELLENDLVMVMEKCDDGWFVGTSRRTGLFGTFPGNYVEKV